MPMVDFQFELEGPACHDGAWFYALRGDGWWRFGPFEGAEGAAADAEARFRRWRARALGHGGWAWRRSGHVWVVTVPEGVAVPGRPLARAPCTRHQPAVGSSGQRCRG